MTSRSGVSDTNRFGLVDLKLKRALRHIGEFSALAVKFSSNVKVGFDQTYVVENGEDVVILTYRIDQFPPPDLGIIVGDCVHNLRSAVDNSVWLLGQIYKVAGSDAQPELLDFPSANSPVDYEAKLKMKKYKAISAFPKEVQDLIRELQPYNTTSWDAFQLETLTNLWNQDKHRSPELMLTQPANLLLAGFIQDGQEFARGVVPEKRLGPEAGIRVNPVVAFAWPGPAMGSHAEQLLLSMFGLVSLNIVARIRTLVGE